MAAAKAGIIGAAMLVAGLAACSAGSGTAGLASSTMRPAVVTSQRPDLLALSRDPGSCHLLLNSGARVRAPAVAVNGTSARALCVNSDAQLTADAVAVQGGLLRRGAISAAPQVEQPPAADWLAALRQPRAPAASCPGAACPAGTSFRAGGTYRLLPGTYWRTINVSSTVTVCIAPGSYVLQASWNLDAPVHPYGSLGCPPLQAQTSDPGVLLYFARGHVQCNSNGGLTLLHAMQRGPYRGLLYWQAGRDTTAIDGAGFTGGGWYEPVGALILNSGATVSALFVAAATITVNARAKLTVSVP